MSAHAGDMGLDHDDDGDEGTDLASRHDREQKKMKEDIKKQEEEREE